MVEEARWQRTLLRTLSSQASVAGACTISALHHCQGPTSICHHGCCGGGARRLHRAGGLATLHNITPLAIPAAMKPAMLAPPMLLSLASRALLLCCAAWVAAAVLRALAGEAAAWAEHGVLKKLSLACVAPLSLIGLSSW